MFIQTCKFYLSPFLIITLINILLFFTLGTYYEEYEGFFSNLLHGTYSVPFNEWWTVSTHFLLYYLYEYIAHLKPEYDIYGIVLVSYNWLGLTLLGLVLYRILKINLHKNNIVLFIFFYVVISIDTFINLCTTRQAFIFIAAVLAYIESRRYEDRLINYKEWICVIIFIFFSTLVRMASVLLFSSIYIVILIIHKKFNKSILLSFFISGFIFLSYHIIVMTVFKESKQVYIYKEKEVFDHDNINYTKLTKLQSLDLRALKDYGITDTVHFSLNFYKDISKSSTSSGFLSLFDGFTTDSFKNALNISTREFYAAKYYILYFILSCIIIMSNITSRRRQYLLHVIFLLLTPLVLCFITIVPARFLIPFLSIAGTMNILIYLNKYSLKKSLTLLFSLLLIFIFIDVLNQKKNYLKEDKKYHELTNRLLILDKEYNLKKPIIINSFLFNNFFIVKPLGKINRQNALFLNMFFFGAEDFQIQSWEKLCNCNVLSLKEKIDYIVSNQNLFLIDDKSFNFMNSYLYEKYKVKLKKTDIKKFDTNLKVCKLNYGF